MGSITSLKCVLTQEHLDAICAKYFVPEEVHPQLPSSDATMHERPAGKVGMYTRFFDYANYRIPFSTFFVSVLTHFRIPFSQLSVFGSAKVSHFEILCRVCNIDPSVGLFRYFYTHNYKNGWFGFTKRPNVRACYSKNLDSVKNWNDHFFWVDEFVVPANARFGWFSGTNIVKDRAPAPSEYNVEHVNTLIAQASPFLRFPEEFLCWVGISRNYLLNKDTYPRFEYENGEEMDLNAFIRTADPRKVRIVERARAENERPIVTVAKHRTVTLLPTSVVRSSGELSASVRSEKFVGVFPALVSGDGGDQGVASVGVGYETDLESTGGLADRFGGKYPSVIKRNVAPSSRLSSSEKTDRTLSLFTGRSGSGFAAGSIRAEEVTNAGLEEIYVPEWTVTKGFELNDGRSCANMIDHFTPPAFFKTVRGMEHEQLFAEFNVSAARNLSLSSEVRLHAEYNILDKRKWKSLAEEKDSLLGAKDKEIEELRSQLLKAKEESVLVAQLRSRVSSLEAVEGSLRGEVASVKGYNDLLEQERNVLRLQVASLESTVAEKDHELSDMEISSSSLRSQNQGLVSQVHELETSSVRLREQLDLYEENMKRLEEFQDNLMRPLKTRLAEIDADFTRCCMRFQESFLQHSLQALQEGDEKGMQEGLTVGIEHGQAGRCLTDLEAYIPSAEVDFNSAVRDLRDLDFPLLQELSNKKDASTWDVMDLLRLDDAVAEALGMTDLQPDMSLSLRITPLSAEALIEPPVVVPATNALSTVVIVPHSGPSVSVEDYENPDLVDVVPKNVTPGPESEENIDASTGGDLAFSRLENKARDVVL
ncbi:hypothetical protein Tco_0006838 [Tanacetum coccineum]